MHRFLLLMGAAGTAAAHGGHGPAGAHLHASDVFGFVLVVALVGAWLVLRGRR